MQEHMLEFIVDTKGVSHDFIGSSWVVLWLIPTLSILTTVGIFQYLTNLSGYSEMRHSINI